MAEENAPQQESSPGPSSGSNQKPILIIVMALINMAFVLGVGVMLYMNHQAGEKQNPIDKVIEGHIVDDAEDRKSEDFIGKLVPLESFLVNLAHSRGRKVVKISMELEVSNDEVQVELEKIKPKVRDIIIIILSGKTYASISNKDGTDSLKGEIRDQVNHFLQKGQIKRVYFTEFIFSK